MPTASDADAARAVATALRRASPELRVAFGGRGAADMQGATVLPGELTDAVAAIR